MNKRKITQLMKILIIFNISWFIFTVLYFNFNRNYTIPEKSEKLNHIYDVQLSATLDYEWNKTWGSPNEDQGNGIAIDGSGNVFITGNYNTSYNSSWIIEYSDIFLLKYNSHGNLLWNTTWGGSDIEIGNGIALDSLGNVYIIGSTRSYGVGGDDVIVLKYDTDGNLLWNTTWGGSDYDTGYGIMLDDSGNVFVTGDTYGFGAGEYDVFLLKYDNNGSLLWNTTWGGSDYDSGYGIALDSSRNVFITGVTHSYGIGDGDVFLIKYDSEGNLLWNKVFGESGYDFGYGVAVDSLENAYITGYSTSYGENNGLLIKYDLNGNLLWNITWGGSETEFGYGIALNGLGSLYITGGVIGGGTGSIYPDVLLLKYECDTDEDGLLDKEELNIYFTNPNDPDTDNDGLTDLKEIELGTNPLDPDTDSDGFNDKQEINSGTDPLIFIDNWLSRGVVISISITTLIICYIVIRKKKVKKVNIIMEKGDTLKAKANLEKAIETYQEAYSKANSLAKFVPKSIRSTIKTKLDDTIILRIEENIIQGERLINTGDLDKAIDNFNTQLENVDAIHEISKRENLRKKIQEYLAHSKMLKTKKVIAELATKYARLEVSDIAEKCGAEESIIIPTIQNMIKNREISAEYFKASKAIAFSQQIDVDEIDNLMKSFEDWEKEGKDKKI